MYFFSSELNPILQNKDSLNLLCVIQLSKYSTGPLIEEKKKKHDFFNKIKHK